MVSMLCIVGSSFSCPWFLCFAFCGWQLFLSMVSVLSALRVAAFIVHGFCVVCVAAFLVHGFYVLLDFVGSSFSRLSFPGIMSQVFVLAQDLHIIV